MNNFDEKISAALSQEYKSLLEDDTDLSIFENVSATFKGKRRKFVILTWGFLLILVALMVMAAFKFSGAVDTREMILWAALFFMAFLGQAIVKLWYWMEMNRVSITRDIHRLELKVDLLASKVLTEK